MTAYLHYQDTNSDSSMTPEDWKQRAQDAFSTTTAAIEQYTDALHFYPEWEELYLFRAEAHRSRVMQQF